MYSIAEIMEFVEDNDVKFVRLAFCDLFGNQKNISILPSELPRANEAGIPFDGSSINGFEGVTDSDLYLFPDLDTLSVLPWRPQQGRVIRFFCDIKLADKKVFACDTRSYLKQAELSAKEMGYECRVGTECEFYLFKTDENGEPTLTTLDNGGYLDMSPLDKGENIRREICLCMDEMGLKPETSHHEKGPGQNEIDFKYDSALQSADNFYAFKTTVKAVSARNGLFASFMPKPLQEESGSGLHINLSLIKNGKNIFFGENGQASLDAQSFVAGVLNRIDEITAFLNPTINSYERFGKFEAPKFISWSYKNHSQLIRIITNNEDSSRMELRSTDGTINIYLALGLIFNAGMEGIKNNESLKPELDVNLALSKEDILNNLKTLPLSLKEAIKLSKNSEIVTKTLNGQLLQKYFEKQEIDVKEYESNNKGFSFKQYFKKL